MWQNAKKNSKVKSQVWMKLNPLMQDKLKLACILKKQSTSVTIGQTDKTIVEYSAIKCNALHGKNGNKVAII